MGAFGGFWAVASAWAVAVASGAMAADAPDPGNATATASSLPCAAPIQRRVLGASALLTPPPAGAANTRPAQGTSVPSLPGYADALATTALGWPQLPHWCVWIEPAAAGVSAEPPTAAAREQARWQQAMQAAVAAWQPLLPIQLVADGEAAQVRIWRRRPPLRTGADGRSRASHGRALLQLLAVERQPGRWRLEPAVTVLIGPGQRREALQATAVHELGHAFGLWGHSPDPADALAAAPGAVPVLVPSARDRATLIWLRRQPTRFGGFLAVPPGLAEPPGLDVPPGTEAPRARASAGEKAATSGKGQGAEETQQLHRHHGGT